MGVLSFIQDLTRILFSVLILIPLIAVAIVGTVAFPVCIVGWIGLLGWGGRRAYLHYYRTAHHSTEKAIKIIGKVFSDPDVDCEYMTNGGDRDLIADKNMTKVRTQRKFHYFARVALLAKAQVGLLKRSQANEMVYRRLCRDEMVKHELRPTDIARMLPLAVAACFAKTDEDFLAESILGHKDLREGHPLGSGFLGK
nr:MAG: hypothetical protein 1 [Tombusviridae sp.]